LAFLQCRFDSPQPPHEFTAIKSPSHVVQTDPPLENPCPENQSLVLSFAIKLRNLGQVKAISAGKLQMTRNRRRPGLPLQKTGPIQDPDSRVAG